LHEASVGRDPVATGLVASLGRPGGNATGVYILTGELNAKRLELLHEMVPRAVTIATLINPANPIAQSIENEVGAAATTAGVRSFVVRAHSEEEIDAAFVLFAKQSGGLIVSNDAYFNTKREQLIALAARHSLPAIFEWREFTALGGLMSYGTSLAGAMREVGACVAKILNGAKPADLPVIQSSRFELVINRKTATALRLTIPQSLLARADEVIE
jgi:putative ABC transport system substrate-binding protein